MHVLGQFCIHIQFVFINIEFYKLSAQKITFVLQINLTINMWRYIWHIARISKIFFMNLPMKTKPSEDYRSTNYFGLKLKTCKMWKIKRIAQFSWCYNNCKSVTINSENSKIFFMNLQKKTKNLENWRSTESKTMTY